MKTIGRISVVSALAILASACCSTVPEPPMTGACAPGATDLLDKVPFHLQQGESWCWAATAEMVMEYNGIEVTQCDQANSFLRRTPCCHASAKAKCDHPGTPNFGRYGFTAELNTGPPLTWEQIKNEITCKSRPIITQRNSIDLNNPTQPDKDLVGHMVVIVGYEEIGTTHNLFLLDPLGETTTWKYSEYCGYACDPTLSYMHLLDYYKIRPKLCH